MDLKKTQSISTPLYKCFLVTGGNELNALSSFTDDAYSDKIIVPSRLYKVKVF